MDGEDPRSPTYELRRNRFPIPELHPSTTSLSPQNFTSGTTRLGVDRCSVANITLGPSYAPPERNFQQLGALPYVLHHPPTESALQTQTIASVIQSASPALTCDSPETANRTSVRYSNSTVSYSTDWTIPDSEDNDSGIKARATVGSPGPAFTQTSSTPRDHDSSSNESQSRLGYSQTVSKGSYQTKQAHFSTLSSGSSATASVNLSESHTQEGSQTNGDVNSVGHNRVIVELFPFTKARLDSLAYRRPETLAEGESSPENSRKQILKVVFGWEQDIKELIRDELNRHPSNSMNAILLSKWLGDADANIMASMFASSTPAPSNWMFLALSQMSGQTMTKELGRSLAQKMLNRGDIHVAASILIGIGEHDEAIEMYTSHHNYMEAILLICLEFPNAWFRQSALVRRWGEHLMMPSRQLLAIRCLSCDDMESSERSSLNAEMAEVLIKYTKTLGLTISTSPEPSPQPSSLVSPKAPSSGTQVQPQPTSTTRKASQGTALKINTSSGNQDSGPVRTVGHGPMSDNRLATIVSGVTLKAEPAFSSEMLTSYSKEDSQRLDQQSTLDTDGPTQCMLPSIGETPAAAGSPISNLPDVVPGPAEPTHHKRKQQRPLISGDDVSHTAAQGDSPHPSIPSLRSRPRKGTPHPDFAPPFRTGDEIFDALMEESRQRSGSKDRKRDGIVCQLPAPVEQPQERTAAHLPNPDSEIVEQGTRSRSTATVRGVRQLSPPPTGQSYASTRAPRNPLSQAETTWKIDQFIDGLHPATSYPRTRHSDRRIELHADHMGREQSVERGRTRRTVPLVHRSPSTSSSESEADLSYLAHHKTSMKSNTSPSLQKACSKKPSSRKRQPKIENSKARAGSEPAHSRRIPPNQKREQRTGSHEKGPNVQRDLSADVKRHHHGQDVRQPRENYVIRDEKDHQRRIGRRIHSTDRDLRATSVENADDKKSAKRHVAAELQTRPGSPPFHLSLKSSTPLTVSTDSEPTLSCQDSVGPSAETRSTQTTCESGDPISRPSSCPSPGEPLPRRFDLGIHPAFHRNIRPSSFKPGPPVPVRRDPSHGPKAALGDIWGPTSDPKNAPVSRTGNVAMVDEPISDQPTSRTSTPPSGGKGSNEDVTNKFRAMADRVRSPSRGRRTESKQAEETAPAATTEATTTSFKTMADRVRSLSRGKKERSTNGEVPYQQVPHPPYESLPPAIQTQETPAMW